MSSGDEGSSEQPGGDIDGDGLNGGEVPTVVAKDCAPVGLDLKRKKDEEKHPVFRI